MGWIPSKDAGQFSISCGVVSVEIENQLGSCNGFGAAALLCRDRDQVFKSVNRVDRRVISVCNSQDDLLARSAGEEVAR